MPTKPTQRPLSRPISAYMLFRAGFVKRFRDPDETYKASCARAKQGWDSLSLSDQNIWNTRFESLLELYNSQEQADLREVVKKAREMKKRNRAQAAEELEDEAKKMREETVPMRSSKAKNINNISDQNP
jgi:formate dehydrogenase maturation protein FdhE